jgi:hypothetical protein
VKQVHQCVCARGNPLGGFGLEARADCVEVKFL